jgi:hypothetical protein
VHLAFRARSSYLLYAPSSIQAVKRTHMSTAAAAALPDRAHAVLSYWCACCSHSELNL